MFFVPWGWHIKNIEIVDWIRWPMLFVSQWRMPVLFLVSGMGTRFAFNNKTSNQYIRERFTRLFIPLVIGILLIVPPQVYIERIANGQFEGSFSDFYPHFFSSIYPEGNFSWHHLWFLPYLLIMSIVATPLFMKLKNQDNKLLTWMNQQLNKSGFNLYLFAAPLLLVELLLEPYFPITHALVGDWYALAGYFLLFITGYILISLGKCFWEALDKIKSYTLLTGILAFSLLLWLRFNYDGSIFMSFVKIINIWSWILTIFAYASKYINRDSKLIRYRNKAVYPFYILHQTIIVLCGFYLMYHPMHYAFKMIIMMVVTFGASWLIYELIILRIPLLRPLFGVKK